MRRDLVHGSDFGVAVNRPTVLAGLLLGLVLVDCVAKNLFPKIADQMSVIDDRKVESESSSELQKDANP